MSDYSDALQYSGRWLDIISREELGEKKAQEISRETVDNFVKHFNKGWVEYRKSVTEAGDYDGTEWRGEGVYYYDVFGQRLGCDGK